MIRKLIHRLLPAAVRDGIKLRRRIRAAEEELDREGEQIRPRPHGLSCPLIVSLTSYPPRFGTLHLTLQSLLQQSVAPDGILLWIAHRDLRKLPRKVRRLARQGIRICPCHDLRSYKKLVFALELHPQDVIVTADDDVHYAPDWLESLIEGVSESEKLIVCHRAHRVVRTDVDEIAPYMQWQWDVQDDAARRPSTDVMPVGIGGILYPPGSLSSEVTDRNLFMALSPTADDLWFYWMARKAGTRHRKVGGKFEIKSWPGSQDDRLSDQNWEGANDRQVRALLEAFGAPDRLS